MDQADTERPGISNLFDIFRGAGVYIFGRGVEYVFGFVFSILFIRFLGVDTYGMYAYGWMLVSVIAIFADLGTDQGIARYVPKYRDDTGKLREVVTLTFVTATVVSTILAVAFFLLSPLINEFTINKEVFTTLLQILAVALIVNVLLRTVAAIFRAFEDVEAQIFVNQVGVPTIKIVAVVVGIVAGLTVVGVVWILIMGLSVILVLSTVYLYTNTPTKLSPVTKPTVIEFYRFSIPLSLSNVEKLLYNRVDLFMIGIFFSSSAVSLYNISTLVATLVLLPLTACNQLLAPIASRLYSDRDLKQLNQIYKNITRWVFAVGFLGVSGGIVFSREILELFSLTMEGGPLVLSVLLLAQLVNIAVGPANYLLIMSDHQNVVLLNHWLTLGLNIVLNYLFIKEFGVVGAAAATGCSLALLNLLRVIELYRFEALFPHSKKLLKPVFANLAALAAMFVVHSFLSGTGSIVVGGVVGLVVFLAVLSYMGFEAEDRELLAVVRERAGN